MSTSVPPRRRSPGEPRTLRGSGVAGIDGRIKPVARSAETIAAQTTHTNRFLSQPWRTADSLPPASASSQISFGSSHVGAHATAFPSMLHANTPFTSTLRPNFNATPAGAVRPDDDKRWRLPVSSPDGTPFVGAGMCRHTHGDNDENRETDPATTASWPRLSLPVQFAPLASTQRTVPASVPASPPTVQMQHALSKPLPTPAASFRSQVATLRAMIERDEAAALASSHASRSAAGDAPRAGRDAAMLAVEMGRSAPPMGTIRALTAELLTTIVPMGDAAVPDAPLRAAAPPDPPASTHTHARAHAGRDEDVASLRRELEETQRRLHLFEQRVLAGSSSPGGREAPAASESRPSVAGALPRSPVSHAGTMPAPGTQRGAATSPARAAAARSALATRAAAAAEALSVEAPAVRPARPAAPDRHSPSRSPTARTNVADRPSVSRATTASSRRAAPTEPSVGSIPGLRHYEPSHRRRATSEVRGGNRAVSGREDGVVRPQGAEPSAHDAPAASPRSPQRSGNPASGVSRSPRESRLGLDDAGAAPARRTPTRMDDGRGGLSVAAWHRSGAAATGTSDGGTGGDPDTSRLPIVSAGSLRDMLARRTPGSVPVTAAVAPTRSTAPTRENVLPSSEGTEPQRASSVAHPSPGRPSAGLDSALLTQLSNELERTVQESTALRAQVTERERERDGAVAQVAALRAELVRTQEELQAVHSQLGSSSAAGNDSVEPATSDDVAPQQRADDQAAASAALDTAHAKLRASEATLLELAQQRDDIRRDRNDLAELYRATAQQLEERNQQVVALENERRALADDFAALEHRSLDNEALVVSLRQREQALQDAAVQGRASFEELQRTLEAQLVAEQQLVKSLQLESAQHGDQMRSLVAQLEALHQQVAEAQAAKEAELQVLRDELAAQQRAREQAEQRVHDAQQQQAAAASALEAMTADLRTAMAELTLAQGESERLSKELVDARAAIEGLTARADAAEQLQLTLADARADAAKAWELSQSLERKCNSMVDLSGELERRAEDAETMLRLRDSECAQLQAACTAHETELGAVRADATALRGKLSETSHALIGLTAQLEAAEARLTSSDAERSEERLRLQSLSEEITQLRQEYTTVRTRHRELETVHHQTLEDLATARAAGRIAALDKQQATSAYESAQQQIAQLVVERDTARAQATHATANVNELRSALEQLQASCDTLQLAYNALTADRAALRSKLHGLGAAAESDAEDADATAAAVDQLIQKLSHVEAFAAELGSQLESAQARLQAAQADSDAGRRSARDMLEQLLRGLGDDGWAQERAALHDVVAALAREDDRDHAASFRSAASTIQTIFHTLQQHAVVLEGELNVVRQGNVTETAQLQSKVQQLEAECARQAEELRVAVAAVDEVAAAAELAEQRAATLQQRVHSLEATPSTVSRAPVPVTAPAGVQAAPPLVDKASSPVREVEAVRPRDASPMLTNVTAELASTRELVDRLRSPVPAYRDVEPATFYVPVQSLDIHGGSSRSTSPGAAPGAADAAVDTAAPWLPASTNSGRSDDSEMLQQLIDSAIEQGFATDEITSMLQQNLPGSARSQLSEPGDATASAAPSRFRQPVFTSPQPTADRSGALRAQLLALPTAALIASLRRALGADPPADLSHAELVELGVAFGPELAPVAVAAVPKAAPVPAPLPAAAPPRSPAHARVLAAQRSSRLSTISEASQESAHDARPTGMARLRASQARPVRAPVPAQLSIPAKRAP